MQKLSKEELKSINGGAVKCVPYPICAGNEVSYIGRNICGWYLYKTASDSICMEYLV
ncbi:bacteriocin [Flavobacterium sp. CSZ]|uniref:bacteriocin-like protein n=1 Tax=Flavobacterium sp. CSZ TaxID=2783791 RepID=UPI00188AE72A|nr:bacteriocin [Flavobacterium sp. CSZ]MBF4486192.1 bacteriocin [Flavobacterium sp. CSZ]